jgi:hypoxanthine phosphoribosyltransferase
MPIQILDKQFEPYIDNAEISNRIAILGEKLSKDFDGKNPLLISILNGSFMFTADLMKTLTIPCEVSFIKLASYHGTESTGVIQTMIGLDREIEGRHVIIVEDIVDTGNTLAAFIPTLEKHLPASVTLATLLYKPNALKNDIKIDHHCFEIPNDFIVGYGLDYDGYGRNLKDIYKIF